VDSQANLVIGYPGHDLILEDIVRADNCYLYDSNGKRYVDLESGVWCTSIGHGNPEVVHAIAEQLSRITHTGFGYSAPVVERAAREILFLFGFDEGRCVFLCSGSEAVEYGVRTAQSVIREPVLMTMADSYFGAYGSAHQRQADEWFCFDWTTCATCPYDQDCSDECRHWAAIPFPDIGGFLFEPGSSSGLVRFPPEKLIQNIVARIREKSGLLLVNEVTTGIGRTGLWFGYQHYGISPDIVAIGKGIGNGYPVSATVFGPTVVNMLEGRQIKYGQSHQNDPLGAAVARRVVNVIREEQLIERSRVVSAALVSGLERILERTGRIKDIRSRGLMIAVEVSDSPDCPFTARIHRELVDKGFILGRRPGINVLRLDPSLTIGKDDIDEFLEVFENVLIGLEDSEARP